MNFRPIFTFTLLFIFMTASAVQADTVLLLNGDRLSGKIISMENSKLSLRTDYAGTVSIDWPRIKSIDSDQDMTVFIKHSATADKESAEDFSSEKIKKVGTDTPFPTARVAAINKTPRQYTFTGKLQAGWNRSEGNTRKENISAAFDLSYRIGRDRFNGQGNHYWGTSKGQRSGYNWMLDGEYNRFLNEKLYFSGSGGMKQDQFQDLNMRSVIGTGLGYQFFSSRNLSLSVEAGPAYVWEEYSSRNDRTFLAGRWAIDFGWWIFPEYLKLFHTQTGLISSSDSDNWLWQSKSGVQFPIVKNFFGSFQYNYDWTNDPVPGKRKVDSRMMFNLGYSFADFPWNWDEM
ncbi:DUF481 domain-containing protein [Maridesulfovibrio hydrothermalis]|uniref:Salt-induced outer membrane protein YdiY n=1 Tax=Maridesulfovibrio hydrothermalis AM13 = DSM 14728 TaxID=1121451 RepID=L0RFC5_9BACT|nr:DUF481 domain-containing protein [Maridesulfovibrio hydrothermalis]CCO25488.1 conserved exported protein of unknown function [Maridesulfovibrio hydrothermalis AM13 = DSM 14728]